MIDFQIPGPGPHTISPLSPLPAIVNSGYRQGTTQEGWAPGAPAIEIEGSQIDPSVPFADGLSLAGTENEVVGLAIHRFAGAGIRIAGNSSKVRGCFLGTEATGTAARPNSYGVAVTSAGNTIGGEIGRGPQRDLGQPDQRSARRRDRGERQRGDRQLRRDGRDRDPTRSGTAKA